MNGMEPRIEIFEPFGAAYEWMKGILFRPFDFPKWLVLGFAAFLSGAWGNGFNFRGPANGKWNLRSTSFHNAPLTEMLPHWLLPFIVVIVVCGVIFALVLLWIASRGRFIFTDCVVKNRAAIVMPWGEYRREGNSYFLFFLAVMFLAILTIGILFLLIAMPLKLFNSGNGSAGLSAAAVFVLVFLGLVFFAFGIFFAVVSQFMVPVMYRRRCSARAAFFDVSKLMLARPGPFILFVLFGIVLVIALAIGTLIATCMTCCVAGLPYVSSVVFLPAFVWLLAFKLLFLRQFGTEYDVWAPPNLPETPVAPAEPPVQPPPPADPPPLPAT